MEWVSGYFRPTPSKQGVNDENPTLYLGSGQNQIQNARYMWNIGNVRSAYQFLNANTLYYDKQRLHICKECMQLYVRTCLHDTSAPIKERMHDKQVRMMEGKENDRRGGGESITNYQSLSFQRGMLNPRATAHLVAGHILHQSVSCLTTIILSQLSHRTPVSTPPLQTLQSTTAMLRDWLNWRREMLVSIISHAILDFPVVSSHLILLCSMFFYHFFLYISVMDALLQFSSVQQSLLFFSCTSKHLLVQWGAAAWSRSSVVTVLFSKSKRKDSPYCYYCHIRGLYDSCWELTKLTGAADDSPINKQSFIFVKHGCLSRCVKLNKYKGESINSRPSVWVREQQQILNCNTD